MAGPRRRRNLDTVYSADSAASAIRTELEAAGQPIGSNDLLIAAHAHALGATVATANADEFQRIRGLNVENWLA